MIVEIFTGLMLVILLILCGFFYIAWRKISVYLTWNTRYQTNEYEQAVSRKKTVKPVLEPKKTEVQGRMIQEVPDLVDITELDFETGYKAVEQLGEASGSPR